MNGNDLSRMPADTSETSRCKLSCSFGVLLVVMGFGFVALAFVLLLAAFRDRSPRRWRVHA